MHTNGSDAAKRSHKVIRKQQGTVASNDLVLAKPVSSQVNIERHTFTSRTTSQPVSLVHFDTTCLLSLMSATSRKPLVWSREILEYIAATFFRRLSIGSIAIILKLEPQVYKKSRAAMHVHCGLLSFCSVGSYRMNPPSQLDQAQLWQLSG